MEATMTAVQQPAIQGKGLRQKFSPQQGAAGADAFSLVFLQLMGEDTGPLAALAAPQEGDAGDSEAQENGALLAAAFLAAQAGGTSALAAQAAAMDALPAVSGNSGQQAPAEPWQLQALLAGQPQAAQEPQQGTAADRAFYTLLRAAWSGEQASRLPGGSPLEANSALRQARQLLSQQEPQPAAAPVDLESLQAQVDAGRFLPTGALAQQQNLPAPSLEQIAQQLRTGILNGAAQGKQEFIVRLEPEGIGEIVVKLSEDRERITLHIFTASAQTARLVSGEIASLQNALRPLHAEVQQVGYTQSLEEQAAAYTAQEQLAGQHQQFSGQQYFSQPHRQPYSGGWGQENEGFEASVQQVLEEDALDTYI